MRRPGISGRRSAPSSNKRIRRRGIAAQCDEWGRDAAGDPLQGAAFSEAFDRALPAFRSQTPAARNSVQNRLILASNELCENYKVLLKKKQARFNFWVGSAATALGAAGGVVTGIDGSRTLSTLSGIAPGVRAEYNQQYFSDLAAHVITKGINARRKEILESLTAVRSQSLEDTTLSKFDNQAGLDALGSNPFYKKALEQQQAATPAAAPAPVTPPEN